jgi:hypothetical protein
MIDPKFKDMLTLANMGVTPDALTAFKNHRDRLQQNEDALKMRNTVLFGNTFANPGSQTNATFIPPKPGSMYDNMISPNNVNNTRRDMMKTQANLAMTDSPINPMFNRPARPSGSTLLNNVNANSAPLMFQNLDKEALLNNLQGTIRAGDAKEKRIKDRKETFNKLSKVGLALQGKDPNASNMSNFMKMLDLQYKTNLMNAQNLKNQDRNAIISFARSQAPQDPSLSDSELNAIMNNDAVALSYGNREAKGNKPEDTLNSYILTGTISPNAFGFLQQNLNKFPDDAEGKMIKDILSKTTYEQYVKNDKAKQDFNSLLRRQNTTGDPNINRYIDGSFVTESEADALNFARESSFLQRVK